MRDFRGTFGDLLIDGPAWQVFLAGAEVDLTRTEFEILLVLASRPREVVTDDELVRAVWGEGWIGDDNNLAVHVSKLRRKLGESGVHPRFVRTVRGVGYRFDPGDSREVTPHGGECVCDALRAHPRAVEVRTDGALRVVAIEPMHASVLGREPSDLLGHYFPVLQAHPWADHRSAVDGMHTLVSSGVREWTARHRVRRADGTSAEVDLATCLDVDAQGHLLALRFVLVEEPHLASSRRRGGGGLRRISDITPVGA